MPIFTPEQRELLRKQLVSAAEKDPRISAAAHTGSTATGREDRWSDIDLALCLDPGGNVDQIVSDWTNSMYRDHEAVAHCDVMRDTTLFRVFLLKNTLQVDIAFWRAADFGARGPTFKLIFGTASSPRPAPKPSSNELIGMAWLYALHVRSSVARGRVWQAEYMLSGMRDNVLALACLRHGLLAHQGRGLDDLPQDIKDAGVPCLVRSLDTAELQRVFGATTRLLLNEIHQADADLATRLEGPLTALVNSLDSRDGSK
jgi:hypothetical protein